MDRIAFAPLIDIPLVGFTLAVFLWHFSGWAYRDDLDTSVDVPARLSTARLRVITFFVGVLLICWISNVAAWSIFALILAIGLLIAMITGGDIDGGAFGFWAAAYLIREWSFGFPQLILHPQQSEIASTQTADKGADATGKVGIVVAPLRPCGDAEIEGTLVNVISDDGRMIDVGTEVVITGRRNGRFCVRPRS